MGTTLHAVVQRQVGVPNENAWMTVSNLDFGKDYELSCAVSETKAGNPYGDPYKHEPPLKDGGIDLGRLLYHIDAIGGEHVQVLSEQEIRSYVTSELLPHPKKNRHMEQLFNIFATARERGWTLRVAFWRI
jgi:hypothetical protein